jgi:surface carbohydrate biosynthesis protein
MNIYLKLEIKSRDFLGRLLLGMYATSKGNEVLIGDDRVLKLVENGTFKPGIILEKSITPSKSRIEQLKNYKNKGSYLFSLDEEGGILGDYEDFLNTRFSEETISLAQKVFCWSEYDYNELVKKFDKFKDKFVASGNPRMDLWRKKFNNIFENNPQKLKKYVFVSSNFCIGVSTKRFVDIVEFYNKAGYLNNDSYQKYFYDFHILYNFKTLCEFISLINKLTIKFPNINFVVRPHPTETVENWKKVLNQSKNLIITKKYSYSSWIINSDLIIHNGCMGGIEAFFRKKNVVAYIPVESKNDNKFANSLSAITKNENEISSTIEEIFIKNEKQKDLENYNEKKQSLHHRFGNFEKETYFYENIYQEFEKLDQNKLSKKNNFLKIILKSKLKFIKRMFFKEHHNEKFPKLTNEEVSTAIKNFKNCDERLKNIKFKILDDNLIKLYL